VIEFGAPEPLYQQIADVIRKKIETGEYPPRTAVPSITKLTSEFGVAEVTVRKALDLLKREGVLVTTPGRGTFVAGNPAR
jgi:GntR family transcriptional regulator